MLMKRPNASAWPLIDDFPAAGRSLPWRDKFSANKVVEFSPTPPGSDAYVMRVQNDTLAFETTSVGSRADRDYIARATIYCNYRPELAADGYERYGLFVRDDGNANFESNSYGGGNGYALIFDTHNGRLRAAKIVDGTITDFLADAPYYATSSAWREFRIDTAGSTIRYYFDGSLLIEVEDETHAAGGCGIGYHTHFTTAANNVGVYVASFSARKAFSGDFDGDGDSDAIDLNAFNFCLKGPALKFPAGHLCNWADVDEDRDVDLADFMALQQVYTGPQ
jgi:hypothetical protein